MKRLACTKWVAQRVFIKDLPTFSDDAAYRAMDFLLDALDEVAAWHTGGTTSSASSPTP